MACVKSSDKPDFTYQYNFDLECEMCKVKRNTFSSLERHYCLHLWSELSVKFPSISFNRKCPFCKTQFPNSLRFFFHIGCTHEKINDILKQKGLKMLPFNQVKNQKNEFNDIHASTITMTNSAPAPKAEKGVKSKATATHPPYAAMIKAAVQALGNTNGSSRQAILKYICSNYKVDYVRAKSCVRISLKKLVYSKALVAAAAPGKKGAGSFKLSAKEPKANMTAVKKKPAATR